MAEPDQDELEKVERDIQAARAQAEEHGTLPDEDHQQRWYESGDAQSTADDDQTIVPPG